MRRRIVPVIKQSLRNLRGIRRRGISAINTSTNLTALMVRRTFHAALLCNANSLRLQTVSKSGVRYIIVHKRVFNFPYTLALTIRVYLLHQKLRDIRPFTRLRPYGLNI